MHDAAKYAFVEQCLDGQEIAIPAPVVEDRQVERFPFDQLAGLGGVERERLVDHHVLAGFEDRASQRKMRIVRRGDDDQVDIGARVQVDRRGVDVRPRQCLRTRSGALLATAASKRPDVAWIKGA